MPEPPGAAGDRHLTGLLVCLVVLSLIGSPDPADGRARAILPALAFSLATAVGFVALVRTRALAVLGATIGIAALALRWWRLLRPGVTVAVAETLAALAVFVLLAGLVLVRVLRPGRITLDRVLGSVLAYLLAGMGWAQAYYFLALTRPDSLRSAQGLPLTQPDAIYFSFVTLTTLGYGDVLAVSKAARQLAVLEALFGQLFTAILIAWLVAMETAHRLSGGDRDPGAGR